MNDSTVQTELNWPLKTLFRLLLVLTLSAFAALAVIDLGLRVPSAPLGIVSMEFCGFAGDCDAMLQAWGARGQQLALLSLGLDYLFMLAYASLLCVALLLRAESAASPVQALWLRRVAVAALVAGVLDALENFCLIQVVLAGHGGGWAVWAAVFASFKFTLCLLAVTVWLLAGWRKKA